MEPTYFSDGHASANSLLVRRTLIIAFVLVLGIGIGALIPKTLPAQPAPNTDGLEKSAYDAGFAAARKLVEESSIGSFVGVSDDIRSLSGTVTAIEGNRISFKFESFNPFENQALSDRVAVATESTKVIAFIETGLTKEEKDEKIESLKAINPQIDDATLERFINQKSFVEKAIVIADIKVGDTISVVASENAKTLREFEVVQIQVQQKNN